MYRYLETHPWITFDATNVNKLDPRTWMLLGEARAMCEILAGVPLQPALAQEMYTITLTRGAQATTAIEGNSLTVEQVRGILLGSYKAPPSRAYQEREVRNVLEALQSIADQVQVGEKPTITAELICEYNRWVLEGTDHEEGATPGEIREHLVGVGRYAGVPAEDCAYLLERLAEWLEGDTFRSEDPGAKFALHVVAAACAHLYIAWIHPFGDGNGRTARLLEFAILARSGMLPLLAAHLLSDHYNLTRDRYYRELRASSERRSLAAFVTYAVEGFVDGLREKSTQVRDRQLRVAWTNYVHEVMGISRATEGRDRRQSLVLAMSPGEVYTRQGLVAVAAAATTLYSQVGPKTLSRDLNRLVEAGLIVSEQNGWRANVEILAAFLPPIAVGGES